MEETPELINNSERKRFEMDFDGRIAFIEYTKAQQKIYLTHTEVPKELEGKGIGSKIVLRTLEKIKEDELTLIPLCPFVAMYIKRHPEWRELVLKGINIA